MDRNIVVRLEAVTKMYKLFSSKGERMKEALHPFKRKFHREFFALRNLDLEIKKGEILGIVGMNGSGKSTLLKIIAGIIQPTSGNAVTHGNVVPMLELGDGFNPDFTGLENIYFYNSILGFNRRETDRILNDIIEFADIGDFINQPLKNYSSGMKARLAFAVSVNINPDILIVDEVLSVGDELFRRKSFARIEEFFKQGKTILFVSHSIQIINQLCTRVIMLHNGSVIVEGSPSEVTKFYQQFLFATPNQRDTLLDGLRAEQEKKKDESAQTFDSNSDIQAILPETSNSESGLQSYLVENFLPQSTVITQLVDLEIQNFRIENANGRKVNHLFLNETYTIAYEILFKENVGQVNLGMSIRTTYGVAVTWKLFPGDKSFLPTYYREDDRLFASYTFTCKFIPDTYFIVVSLRRDATDGKELIFRAVDYYAFTVVSDKKHDKGGFFDAEFIVDVN